MRKILVARAMSTLFCGVKLSPPFYPTGVFIPFASIVRHRGLGYRSDPRDERDRSIRTLGLGEGPRAASVRSKRVRVRDQKGTQSCAGQAVAVGIETAYHQLGAECPALSALAPYYWSRALWSGHRVDGGTYLRTTIQAVQKLGCPDEQKWAFSVLNVNRAPPPTVLFNASKRRGIRGYYRIDAGDVDGVRRAISAGYPVVGGWGVDHDFFADGGPSLLDTIPAQAIIGGHAMLIEEYDAEIFGILNSYGTGWRDNGRARATTAFVAQATDLWALDVWVE